MTILLSNVDRGHYTDRAPWTPYWSDCYKYLVSWYMESCQDKENLVICYGDSWTWGDSLGKASAFTKTEDTDFRLKNVYGAHLSNMLQADFVNIATPGIFNYWIHDRLQILLNHDLPRLSEQYNKIYIVVTLTELGRDFEFDKYSDEFKTFCNFDSDLSAETILKLAEQFDFNKLQSFEEQLPENVSLIVGRNFTTTYHDNIGMLKHLMPKNWSQILFEPQGFEILSNVPMVSFGVSNFNAWICQNKLDSTDYKKFFVDEINSKASRQGKLLADSIYNCKKASKHPTPEGHRLWADYLFNYIEDNKL